MKSEETIFTRITQLANQHKAINLGQGFPNFDPDPKLVEIIKELAGKAIHQYAPMQGNSKLINKIQDLTSTFYHREITPQNVLVTAGATQAIFTTISALISKGDEVILFDPAYDCYDPPIRLRGGQAIHLNLTFPEFKINWELVRSHISTKTKLIILNNPHNPSGAIFTESDISELKKLLFEYPNLLVLSDEVYEYISFDKHLSMNLYPEIRERAIIISSFGKTLHLTGWKIGYILAEEELLKKIIHVHQYNVFSVNSFSQEVIAHYLDLAEVAELALFFQTKKDQFLNTIAASRFKIIETKGTYFQLLDYSRIESISDGEMALKLIERYGIASIPVSVFYKDQSDNKVLRFCFGKDNETLKNAAEILCQI